MFFCCPRCKEPLSSDREEYACRHCVQKYPVTLGFPDFRSFPGTPINDEDDYKKAAFLAEKAHKLDFQELDRLYWEITPGIPEDLSRRFIRHDFTLIDKGVDNLKEIKTSLMKKYQAPMTTTAVLDIGCGTGGLLAAASGQFKTTVGIDPSLQRLVIARKRLNELGLEPPLCCGCAEYLPFRDEWFDLILAGDVIEHVRDPISVLRECRRVLRRDGVLFIATPNRFSLTPEPHVRVWGVGFLPRRWMDHYVRLIRGIPYRDIKNLSFFELKRLLKKSFWDDHQILLPSITKTELNDFSSLEKKLVVIYDWIRKIPALRLLLYLAGPFFHVICRLKSTPLPEDR